MVVDYIVREAKDSDFLNQCIVGVWLCGTYYLPLK